MNEQPTSPLPGRLGSLDAYRGLAMFLMLAEVLHFCRVSEALPNSGFWKFLCHHQTHSAWVGCSLHDLIQPSFSFMVGVALPFSIASRLARGQSRSRMIWHALWRSLVLVLLGVFLRSVGHPQTLWTFVDTLSQIGLGYFFLFLLGLRTARGQWIALGVIVVGYWAAFALYPLPDANFDLSSVAAPLRWREQHWFTGFAAHWNKNTNPAWAFDVWWLNLFPREKPFAFNGGGYSTLSFIPTLGTMILGLIAGGVLRSNRAPWQKVKWLSATGIVGLVLGSAIGWAGICPVVKPIWTPSWVIFSGGWCFLLLAGFFLAIDVLGRRRWAFPLIVVGMNSIAAYSMSFLIKKFIAENLKIHLGQDFFKVFGTPYEPLFLGATTLLVMWLLLFWMYRRKLFLRI
jgi:heparan-alpha-glucosaminide N-acetyltransferase